MTITNKKTVTYLPDKIAEILQIENARERFEEARLVATKLLASGVQLLPQPDHAAIFSDPPSRVAGLLKSVGYRNGWDTRCYPSPVDGCDYINVPAGLPVDSPRRSEGWFDYVAVVHPVDQHAREQMLSQGYGNPFIHHLTFGIQPLSRNGDDDVNYAARVIPYMVDVRKTIARSLGQEPGTLICALPRTVIEQPDFDSVKASWMQELDSDHYQIEEMQGGGFLIQFFVLQGGKIEVALRVDTQQTFNPQSVEKISEDEISTDQGQVSHM